MPRSGCFVILVLLSFFFAAGNALSQFSYDKIGDEADFDFQKPVEFYTNPRYNRVEGLFGHIGVKLRPEKLPGFSSHFDAGVGFWNESDQKFRFNAGFRKDFMDLNRLSLGVDVFRDLDSEDDWIVGDAENTIFSLLFREDYKDYYGVHGLRLYADKKVAGNHTIRVELSRRTYTSLKRNINWSVFGGTFEENPSPPGSAIAEGDELGVKLITALDWRDNPIFPLNGWYVEGIYERTADDFDTDGLFLTVKRFHQTYGSQRLLIKGMAGSRTGSIAEQYNMDLGGIGSLRAFDDKEFTGNRLLMLNANYLFGGDILQKIPLQEIPFFGTLWTTLSLGIFVDSGWAGFAPVNDGLLSGFDNVDFKTDLGLSLLVLEGVFRIDMARRTSSSPGRDDYRVTFRILDSF